MKNAPIAQILALTSLLAMLLMSCSDKDTKVYEPTPRITPSPKPTYDFGEIEPPPAFLDMSGFENSRWGDTIEEALVGASKNSEGASMLRLVDYSASVAGLQFTAEYCFYGDDDSSTKLVSGAYYRDFYIDAFDPISGIKQAIADYNLLLTYLTELYGPPWQSFLDIDGNSHVDVTDNINDFLGLRAREAATIWTIPQPGGAKPSIYLSLSSNGRLYINFISDVIWEKPDGSFAYQSGGDD